MTESQDPKTTPGSKDPEWQPVPGLNVTKIVASAAGAVLAAVVLSKFGVAGTITGAALGSIVSTLGTDLNQHYLSKSTSRLQELRDAQRGARPGRAAESKSPESGSGWQRPSWMSWKALAIMGVGGFLVAMLAITGFELAVGEPLAGLFGHEHSQGRSTTFGEVTGGGGRQPSNQPATSVETGSTTESTLPGSTLSTATTLAPTSTTAPAGQQSQTTTAHVSPTTQPPSGG